MSTDADKYWESFANKLRKHKGLRPLTPHEADDALRRIHKRPASDEEVQRILDAAFRDEIIEAELERETGWTPTFDFGAIDTEALALFRGQGDDSDAEDVEEELRRELLNDPEPEEDGDGMGD